MIVRIVLRTLFIYAVVVGLMRFMGKRELGQLSPSDLVVAVMVAELAAIPMERTGIPLYQALVPIATLVGAQVVLASICLKSPVARKWATGTPSVLVENGQIVEKELRKLRYSVNDLISQLRDKSMFNLSDVEFAILETSGKLSVIPKSQKRPVTAADINVPTSYEGLPLPLIVDGVVDAHNLEKMGLNEAWLSRELLKHGLTSASQVLFAALETSGNLYVSKKGVPSKIQGKSTT